MTGTSCQRHSVARLLRDDLSHFKPRWRRRRRRRSTRNGVFFGKAISLSLWKKHEITWRNTMFRSEAGSDRLSRSKCWKQAAFAIICQVLHNLHRANSLLFERVSHVLAGSLTIQRTVVVVGANPAVCNFQNWLVAVFLNTPFHHSISSATVFFIDTTMLCRLRSWRPAMLLGRPPAMLRRGRISLWDLETRLYNPVQRIDMRQDMVSMSMYILFFWPMGIYLCLFFYWLHFCMFVA